MAGVNDLGLLKAAAGGGCVKKGFKKGMMDPPMEKVRPPTVPLSLPWWQIPCLLEVFPGLSGLGPGEQEEKGTWPVL